MRSRLISHISKPSVGIRAVLCVSTLRISNVANVNFIIIVKFITETRGTWRQYGVQQRQQVELWAVLSVDEAKVNVLRLKVARPWPP